MISMRENFITLTTQILHELISNWAGAVGAAGAAGAVFADFETVQCMIANDRLHSRMCSLITTINLVKSC